MGVSVYFRHLFLVFPFYVIVSYRDSLIHKLHLSVPPRVLHFSVCIEPMYYTMCVCSLCVCLMPARQSMVTVVYVAQEYPPW